MRNNAGREDQSGFLRCRVDRSLQATTGKAGAPGLRINRDLPHPREVNHQAAIARTEAGKAVSATADGGKDPGFGGSANSPLYVAHIGTARNEGRLAIKHAVPDAARAFIFVVMGTQQVAFKSL